MKKYSDNIIKLNDYQHSRLRTEMYLGSREIHEEEFLLFTEKGYKIETIRYVPAMWAAVREILDNAIDEIVSHNRGTTVKVFYDKETHVFKIEDDGKGIPIEWIEEENVYIPTLVFTHTKSGRNFLKTVHTTGTNGLGASIVNFCSEFFNVATRNNGKIFFQSFREENELIKDLIVEKPIVRKTKNVNKSGTTIEFKLSSKVFKNYISPEKLLESHMRLLAFLHPDKNFYYNGNKIRTSQSIKKFLNTDSVVFCDFQEENVSIKTYIFVDKNYEGEKYFTVVNNIPAFDNGNHISPFRRTFFRKLVENIPRKMKNSKITLPRNVFNRNIIVIFVIEAKDAMFDSQSKTRFVSDISKQIEAMIDNNIVKKFINVNSEWIEDVLKSFFENQEKEENRKIAKKINKNNKTKVSKLIDATSSNRKECILFITEGDSALSNLIAVRNPKIHAGYPLRGKIPNVSKLSVKDLVENKELSDLMNIIGLNPVEKTDRKKLRYGAVYIAHDADHDGYNIGSLIINFFYKYWPELFDPENPYFFVFQTPFIIAEKGNERKYWYALDYDKFKPEEWKGYSITRAKGLGSLGFEHWRDCLENPSVIPLVDDGNLEKVLDLIFNPEKSDLRKKWISDDLREDFIEA